MQPKSEILDTTAEIPRRLWSTWTIWLVLVLSLTITLLAWNESRKVADSFLQKEFHALIKETRNKLDDRIVLYTEVLRSATALFAASGPTVSSEQWRQFNEKQELDRHYPAIPSVAFARSAKDADLQQFVEEMHRSAIEDFAVRPPGKRPYYVVNAYAEPFVCGNVKALGYDMWQDADRRMTMEPAA